MRAVITVPAITVPITVPEDPLSKGSGCLTAHIYFIVAPPRFMFFIICVQYLSTFLFSVHSYNSIL